MSLVLVLSCEHGGHRVPAAWSARFRGAGALLRSHRGWDRGALELARELARRFRAPLAACTTTRLLADPNRSRSHPRLFSERTRGLSEAEREALLDRVWRPHREAVEACVRAQPRGALVLHLSVHSFTPVLDGERRRADAALLYDPGRAPERALADRWWGELGELRPDLRLRRNYPYRGVADGLTTHLRRRFGARRYAGLELEVNQRFPAGGAAAWRALRGDLARSLGAVLAGGVPR